MVAAKDIDDRRFIASMRRDAERRGVVGLGGCIWTMAEHDFPDFPPKVVLAKARQLLKRGVIAGCGCGCRGDLLLIDQSYAPDMRDRFE